MAKYTLEQFMDQIVLSETLKIMQTHPYHAMAIIAVGIEIIGKCFSKGTFDKSGSSEDCFCVAINKCPELAKYKYFNTTKKTKKRCCIFTRNKTKNTNELYSGLRCAMLHSLIPDQIFFVHDNNDFGKRVIGCKELYNDVFAAWQSVKSKNTKVKKDLSEVVFEVIGPYSGGTSSNIFKSQSNII